MSVAGLPSRALVSAPSSPYQRPHLPIPRAPVSIRPQLLHRAPAVTSMDPSKSPPGDSLRCSLEPHGGWTTRAWTLEARPLDPTRGWAGRQNVRPMGLDPERDLSQ